ncbi:hypothetical protein CTA2_11721 [Colletotrichum tanaceti]|uniref:Uncharacterized protein n=1 Tax=Colletotrichum tanaceti TaxID=1306861 RepID=A0A4U6X071_9PEZI|nr:hypothetical protein CTA2_11721 [Colletotrichum tanaceti]TKW48394.1 hypothetical protein CTA1_11591 [Colletotrichum tanaceti]
MICVLEAPLSYGPVPAAFDRVGFPCFSNLARPDIGGDEYNCGSDVMQCREHRRFNSANSRRQVQQRLNSFDRCVAVSTSAASFAGTRRCKRDFGLSAGDK